MICLAVLLNGTLVCNAGIAGASMLSAILAGGSSGDSPASFHVAGMQSLSEDRTAHVYWVQETPLSNGDRLLFSLVETGDPSPPIEVKPTDSPEHLTEQRAFEEFERRYAGPERPPEIRWNELEMGLANERDFPVPSEPRVLRVAVYGN
jgi:hypothetical protein